MSRHCKGNAGFTLLELMAVVTLMAMAVSLVTMNTQGLPDEAKLDATESHIASTVRLAQTQAMSSGMPRLLRFREGEILLCQPCQINNKWAWSEPTSVQLPHSSSVCVGQGKTELSPARKSAPDGVIILPAMMEQSWELTLTLRNGASRTIIVTGMGSIFTVEK